MADDNTDTLSLLASLTHENIVPAAVGRVTIAWNNVSYAVFQLFRVLSQLDEETAKAVFFVVQSDRAQREMTSSLVTSKLQPIAPKLAKRARSLLGSIDKELAGKRNDIQHVVLLDENSPETVRLFHHRGHLKNKEGKDLVTSFNDLAMQCLSMASDFMKLNIEVINLPHFHRKALAEALQLYSARQELGESANWATLGFLDFPNTGQHTPEED